MTKLAIIAMKKISSGQKNLHIAKGQLNSEWIYEVIISPKMPTKNYKDFCPVSLLEDRAEIFVEGSRLMLLLGPGKKSH